MKCLASVSVAYSCIVAVSTFSFILFVSLVYDFQGVNGTRCKDGTEPFNFFPSISASVGRNAQRYIWRMGIAFMILPRILDGFLYILYFGPKVAGDGMLDAVSKICLLIHSGECLSLALLAYVSSSDNYPAHKFGFVCFMICQTIHMNLHISLFQAVVGDHPTKLEAKSLRLKRISRIINHGCFLFAMYAYWRHDAYCENYVYSVFGLCEWSTVFANIGFHFSGYYDFKRISVYLDVRDPRSNSITERNLNYAPITQA